MGVTEHPKEYNRCEVLKAILSIRTVTLLRNISEKTWVHSYPIMPQATLCLRKDQTLARCHVSLLSWSAMHDVWVTFAKRFAVAMGANVLKPMTHGSTSCNICCSTNVEQCCTDVLNGIQLVSIFVQYRSTTFKYSKYFEACLQRIWTRLVNRSLEPQYGEKKPMKGDQPCPNSL